MDLRGASPDRPPARRFAARRGLVRAAMRSRRGGSTIEYGLILAFITLMMFGALQAMAGTTVDLWNDMAARVTRAR